MAQSAVTRIPVFDFYCAQGLAGPHIETRANPYTITDADSLNVLLDGLGPAVPSATSYST
jgi:hypothetical protein